MKYLFPVIKTPQNPHFFQHQMNMKFCLTLLQCLKRSGLSKHQLPLRIFTAEYLSPQLPIRLAYHHSCLFVPLVVKGAIFTLVRNAAHSWAMDDNVNPGNTTKMKEKKFWHWRLCDGCLWELPSWPLLLVNHNSSELKKKGLLLGCHEADKPSDWTLCLGRWKTITPMLCQKCMQKQQETMSQWDLVKSWHVRTCTYKYVGRKILSVFRSGSGSIRTLPACTNCQFTIVDVSQ